VIANYPRYAAERGIPKRYHRAGLDLIIDENNKKAMGAARHFEDGFLTLHGDAGTGKTWIACAMARARIIQDLPIKFVRCISMLNSIRSDFDRRERVNMTNLKNHPWLIIDDLGAEKRTDWVVEAMYDLLDYRYAWEKPTIITTNMNGAEIAEAFGVRIASRIKDAGPVIEVKGKDRRLK
jgi:DNA replication protein DnaC